MSWRRLRMPLYLQGGYSDCGPAGLRMVLASRGINVSLEQLHEDTGNGTSGTTASALLRVARQYGLDGRGVRCDLHGLRALTPGAILFWRFNHYVVLERATRSHLVILDPALGRRRLSLSRAGSEFTGIALEFAPGNASATRLRWPEVRALEGITQFLPRTRKWLLALAVSVILLAYHVAFPLTLGWLVGQGPDAASNNAVSGLLWGGLLAGAMLSYGVLQVIRSRLLLTIQCLIESRIAHVTMARLMRLPIGFFTARDPGDLTQKVRTAAHVRQAVSVTTLGAAFDAVLVLGLTAVLAYREIWLGLVVLACALVFVAGIGFSWSRQRYLAVDASGAQMHAEDEVHEIFTAMRTVKALGAEDRAYARWAKSLAAELATGARRRRVAGAAAAFASTVQFGVPLAVLLAGLLSAAGGRSSLATAVVLAVLSVGLFISLSNLSAAATTLAELYPQLIRLQDLLASPTEPNGSADAARLEQPPAICLDAVSFRYPGTTEDVVDGVAAAIEAGSTLAIIGPSGAGKSTIAMLLSGMLIPTGGRMVINNRDLAELDSAEFRHNIGYVDQDSRLLSGTILDNIRLGNKNATLDDVRLAARRAQIDEFIQSLPTKYDTLIGSGGTGISGGQRQRIALARVLVKQPSLLILDEATSAVDSETEAEIFRQIRELGATLIILGHRVPMVPGATSILEITTGGSRFMDSRQLVEG